MLDISTERVVSLTQATKLLPRRRRGRKPHPSTLFRWALSGCRGVVLETVQVGGTKCTSVEALQRFCDRLSRGGAAATGARPKTDGHGGRVDRALDEAGL